MSKIFEEIERRGWEEGYREGIQLGLEEVKSLWKKEGIYIRNQTNDERICD